MQWFQELRVTVRLILSFLIVAAVGAVVSALGIFHMGRISASTERLYNHELQTLKAVQAANIHLLYASRAQMGLLSASTKGERNAGIAELKKAGARARGADGRGQARAAGERRGAQAQRAVRGPAAGAEEAHGRLHHADHRAIAGQLAVRRPRGRGQRAAAEGFARARASARADGGAQRRDGQGEHGACRPDLQDLAAADAGDGPDRHPRQRGPWRGGGPPAGAPAGRRARLRRRRGRPHCQRRSDGGRRSRARRKTAACCIRSGRCRTS